MYRYALLSHFFFSISVDRLVKRSAKRASTSGARRKGSSSTNPNAKDYSELLDEGRNWSFLSLEE